MTNNDLKTEIKIIQLNPKFRLFLLILFSWVGNIFLFPVIACFILIPYLSEHWYIIVILLVSYLFLAIIYRYYIINVGIKFLPKDLHEYYVKKNNDQLRKIKNLDIANVTSLFNVTPICDEVYSKKRSFETRTKDKFVGLSWIEASSNRLVVNGKINNLDFSWGVVTKMKKINFKIFMLSILYFGPIVGISFGLFSWMFVNAELSKTTWRTGFKKYKKLGCLDLFPYNVGRVNSENYLIFSAKIKNSSNLITLIPKSHDHQDSNLNVYEWPENVSSSQKQSFQKIVQKMSFLPSIYVYHNNITIVMKKYHFNVKDNNELQTWELLKNQELSDDLQFNYFNQAVKIYNFFNGNNLYMHKSIIIDNDVEEVIYDSKIKY